MNPHHDTLINRQLELLHKSAFGCMDARQALTEEEDPQAAHKLISACIEVLTGVRDSLEVQHDIEPTDYFAETDTETCPVCDTNGCPVCQPERFS